MGFSLSQGLGPWCPCGAGRAGFTCCANLASRPCGPGFTGRTCDTQPCNTSSAGRASNTNTCCTRSTCCTCCTCCTCRACNTAACSGGTCCTCRACCSGCTRCTCCTCHAWCACGASRPSYASDDYHITPGPAFRPAAGIAGITRITIRMPWIAVRTAAVLILSAAGMTGISILSTCITAAAVSHIPGHRLAAESAVPAAAAAPVSTGISIHTHSPLFLYRFCVHFILCALPKIVPLFSYKQKRERNKSNFPLRKH